MQLGNFSISLAVKDIKVSKDFYEKLGFEFFGGDMEQNWVILKNGNSIIGLFQGMFENNIITFNPKWDENAQTIESLPDIRKIQEEFKNKGISIPDEVDEKSEGPASFMLTDPDGNAILFDQHV